MTKSKLKPNPLFAKFPWLYEAPEWRKDIQPMAARAASEVHDELAAIAVKHPDFKMKLRRLAAEVLGGSGVEKLTSESFARVLYQRFGRFMLADYLNLLPERFSRALENKPPRAFLDRWEEHPIPGAPPITQDDWNLVAEFDLNDDAWGLFEGVIESLAEAFRTPDVYRSLMLLIGGNPLEIDNEVDEWHLDDSLRVRVRLLDESPMAEKADPKLFDKLIEQLFATATPILVATEPIEIFQEMFGDLNLTTCVN